MDGYFWVAILLWISMALVQDRILKYRLGLEWGWWSLANTIAFTVALFVAGIATLTLLFSSILDSLQTLHVFLILGMIAIIFAAIAALTQWIILRWKQVPKPILWAIINPIVAIATYILLVSYGNFASNNDWRISLASFITGAIIGAVTGKALDLYCTRAERLALEQTDEYWEEKAWEDQEDDE